MTDYSHLTPYLPVPKMVLPNLFQLIHRKGWKPKLYYCKVDFKNAFFHILIHPKSREVTTFRYKKANYVYNVMPFGISIAPYAMQAHLNPIWNALLPS